VHAQPRMDSALLTRVRSGSPEALAELYTREAPGLLALARRLTGSAQDAEDVLHDLFLGLPEALRHYDERGKLEQWLRRVAARLALSRLRSASRRGEVDIPDSLPITGPGTTPEEKLTIERAVDELPAALRTVLVLKMTEGYSHAEIATTLGITSRASEQRLHRALEMLRARLTEAD
jgi:RNA polymerase sigma-70 factor, ECF subfamily